MFIRLDWDRDIGHLITSRSSLVFVVALLARGREMVATMTLGLVFGAMLVVAFAFTVTHWGYGLALSRATWNFADSLAIVIAEQSSERIGYVPQLDTYTSMI